MQSILVVDDEPNYQIVLSELLKDEGFEVFTAESALAALPIVRGTELDLILTDMKMPGMDGIEFLKKVKEFDPELPVILLTAYAEVERAVEAMHLGAFTYLSKPFSNQQLLASAAKAIEHYSLVRELRRLRQEVTPRAGFAGMIGKSAAMQTVYQLIEKVAPTHSSVLVTGESGTGKELVARAIHSLSTRKEAPFLAVNCAAISEHLLESELFGHEKGAFTDAITMRKGLFERADGGTLFLDEIGELAPRLQAKLLRVLQEKTFERVGGNQTLKADVRILAATNKDLKDEIERGSFREDLYYRLNVIHIHLPPLRERTDDIPSLVTHFMGKYGKDLDISVEALRLLVSLPWEGNVRELENTIERATILCENNTITPDVVQPDGGVQAVNRQWTETLDLAQIAPEGLALNEIMDGIEEKLVRRALEECDNVQARAAEKLGLSKSLLQYKMKKFHIQRRQATN